MHRHLNWDGCLNVRDLGGLRTTCGKQTAWGALVRSDNPGKLTANGWQALQAHGIRTIIDLRDDSEREADSQHHIFDIETVKLPLEDLSDSEFWQRWHQFNGTSLYYKAFLEQSPGRVGSVFSAIARACPGGIVIHCGVGRDRTGLITLLLLALAQVDHDEIALDYELSEERLQPLLSLATEMAKNKELLARENTTNREVVLSLLSSIDVEAYLVDGGLNACQVEAVRSRLVEHRHGAAVRANNIQ